MHRILILALLIGIGAKCYSFSAYSALKSAGVAYADNFMADDIVGKWHHEENVMTIQIDRIGNKYYGKMIWLERPFRADGTPKVDEFNPDPALRSVPFIGLRVMKDMQYKGKGVWGNGTIYDPETGKTYGCKITLESINAAMVRGYIGIALIGKSVRFDRIF